jgi:hypothetical protein
MKQCNLGPGSECAVQFYGTQSDYDDVAEAHKRYLKENDEVKIELPSHKRYPQSLEAVSALIEKEKAECTSKIAEIEKNKIELIENDAVQSDLQALLSGRDEFLTQLKSSFEPALVKLNDAINDIRAKATLAPELEGKTMKERWLERVYSLEDHSFLSRDFSTLVNIDTFFDNIKKSKREDLVEFWDIQTENSSMGGGSYFKIDENEKQTEIFYIAVMRKQMSVIESLSDAFTENFSNQITKNTEVLKKISSCVISGLFFPIFDGKAEDCKKELAKYKLVSRRIGGGVYLDEKTFMPILNAFIARLEKAEQILLETVDNGKDAIITCVNNFISWSESEYDKAIKIAEGQAAIQNQKRMKVEAERLLQKKELAFFEGKLECLDELAVKIEESAE